MSANTTGPAELRRWAVMSRNPKAAALFDCASAWEADIASREAWMASEKAMLVRAERAEAALERARALLPADLIECVTKPGRGYTECGCGRDHCSYCLYTKWEHDLAALLGSGGAA